MEFFTIEFDYFKPQKIFLPTIPKELNKEDNDFLPRIILSPSIKLCLQNLIQEQKKKVEEGSIIYIYKADIDINDPNLFGPDVLYNERFVYHAYENKEYWYMAPLTMTGFKVKLIDFEMEFDFAWKAITKNNLLNAAKYSVKNKFAYNLIEDLIEDDEEENTQKIFYEITDILDEYNLYNEMQDFEIFLSRDWQNTINKIKKFNYVII